MVRRRWFFSSSVSLSTVSCDFFTVTLLVIHSLFLCASFVGLRFIRSALKTVMLIRTQVIRPRPENSRPRPRTFSTDQGQAKARYVQGQGHSHHTATVLDQNKSSDVVYLLQSITINDKNKITVITSASVFYLLLE